MNANEELKNWEGTLVELLNSGVFSYGGSHGGAFFGQQPLDYYVQFYGRSRLDGRLYTSMDRDRAHGYGCEYIPQEFATDGTNWAKRELGKWVSTDRPASQV